MLRITITTDTSATRIALEGRLAGAWVEQLRDCWLREVAKREPGAIRVDLADVVYADAAGRKLLESIHAQGAQLCATSLLMRATVEEIAGRKRSDGSFPDR